MLNAGVNTGFGATADTQTTEIERLQHTLTRELSYDILFSAVHDHRPGPLHASLARCGYDLFREHSRESYCLPWTWVRAAILIRINSLIKGFSGVHPLIVERMRDLLIHDIIPMIPLRGSISASGDLNPLAYVNGTIQGKSTSRVLSTTLEDIYADQSLHKAGLTPVALKAKEGLAVVNGIALSATAGVLALHDAHGLAVLSQILTSMSVEALGGTAESFDSFFREEPSASWPCR
ncbi:hypothetical protein MMC17_000375 [Xylographa soralifera]|nr:hypothetical protein [Xylographa soralifera]